MVESIEMERARKKWRGGGRLIFHTKRLHLRSADRACSTASLIISNSFFFHLFRDCRMLLADAVTVGVVVAAVAVLVARVQDAVAARKFPPR